MSATATVGEAAQQRLCAGFRISDPDRTAAPQRGCRSGTDERFVPRPHCSNDVAAGFAWRVGRCGAVRQRVHPVRFRVP